MKKTFVAKNGSSQFQCQVSKSPSGKQTLVCSTKGRYDGFKVRTINCSPNSNPIVVQEPYVGGDPICPLNNLGIRIPAPVSGTYDLGNGLSITLESADGVTVSWSANKAGISDIVVRQGASQNRYSYTGSEQCGSNLQAPSGLTIANVDICYNLERVILANVTASNIGGTSLRRTSSWSVYKSGSLQTLTLQQNQTSSITYTTTVTESHVDDQFTISGILTISNTNTDPGQDVNITGVSVPGATLQLPGTLPIVLAPQASMAVSYTIPMTAAGSGIITAQVSVNRYQTTINVSEAIAYDFQNATVNSVDECVNVTDSDMGYLGQICYPQQSQQVFQYSTSIGPYSTCGQTTITSSATLTTLDTQTTTTSSWNTQVTVSCPSSADCTYGVEYWSTSLKPKRNIPQAWMMFPQGPNTPFFLSNQSYRVIMVSGDDGNIYYRLAKQYIAALLNRNNGCDISNVQQTLNVALSLFNAYPPSQLEKLKPVSQVYQQFRTLWAVLEKFNNGGSGPGRCGSRTSP